jgi:hypothetical protein
MKTQTIKLGDFEINSGKMYCSDPCYSKQTWCQALIDNVENGKWIAKIKMKNCGSWGNRVSKLIVQKAGMAKPQGLWVLDSEIGVDSGQAGFFDSTCPLGEGEYGDKNSFYGKCCDLTLNEPDGGVIENGCVSRSGYGDGGYVCRIGEKDCKVVYAEISFC